jgi:hypothetical protein
LLQRFHQRCVHTNMIAAQAYKTSLTRSFLIQFQLSRWEPSTLNWAGQRWTSSISQALRVISISPSCLQYLNWSQMPPLFHIPAHFFTKNYELTQTYWFILFQLCLLTPSFSFILFFRAICVDSNHPTFWFIVF